MHLITLRNKEDASAVAHALSGHFPTHTIMCDEVEDERGCQYKITAKYNRSKKLSQRAADVYLTELPTYAQAFYAGMEEALFLLSLKPSADEK